MIRISKLNKVYKTRGGEATVFSKLDAEFPDKGIIAVCGTSGCGKTTLLNCIGGMDSFSGSIRIGEYEMGSTCAKDDLFRQTHIGVIFQDYNLIEEESVKYNLQVAIDVAGTSSPEDENRIKTVLSSVRMDKYIKRRVCTLSGGQKQRIAIARALINSPDMLLADEPTGHLDNSNTRIVLNILAAVSKKIPVIWVSHEKALVEEYADIIMELPSGKIGTNINKKAFYSHSAEKNIKVADIRTHTVKEQVGPIELTVQYTDSKDKFCLSLIIEDGNLQIIRNEKSDLPTSDNTTSQAIVQKTERIPQATADAFENRKETEDNFNISFDNVNKTGKNRNLKLQVFETNSKKWLSILSLIMASLCIALSLSLGNAGVKTGDLAYLDTKDDEIKIINLNGTFSESYLSAVRQTSGVRCVLPNFYGVKFLMSDGNLLQTQVENESSYFFSSILPITECGKIVYGRLPENPFEICMDLSLAQGLLVGEVEGSTPAEFGYIDVVNFMNANIYFSEFSSVFKIVGITDGGAPMLYFTSDAIDTVTVGLYIGTEHTVFSASSFVNSSGMQYSLEKNETVISYDVSAAQGLGIGDTINMYMNDYTIVDVAELPYDNLMLLNEYDLKSLIKAKYYSTVDTIYVLVDNPTEIADSLIEKGFYLNISINDKQPNAINILTKYLVSIIVLIVAVVFFIISEKGRIAAQKNRITVFRCLGMTGRKMMLHRLLAVAVGTAVITIPLYSSLVWILNRLAVELKGVIAIGTVSLTSYFIGLVLIIGLALLSAFLAGVKVYYMRPARLMKVGN